jgi:hypothetical protein
VSGKPIPLEEILTLLVEAPSRLAALTTRLTPAQLRTAPAPGEWSAVEVLTHLRSCADVWGDCIARILAEDKPTLRAVDPRTWVEKTDYRELEFQPSLRAYTAQRKKLMAVLESLPPKSWSRSAMVTGAGAPLERTVLSYAQRMARHERPHIKQIRNIVDMIGK